MANSAPTAGTATIGGHPKGLYLLFVTEMWERMSYYGMRALLVLYMVASTDKGGFGWDSAKALQIYGLYTGLVYLTPLAGGFIADRFIGQRTAVTLGGVLMMIGHFLMAVPGVPAFYAALAFLIIGNGFFKPNISTMVGGLYEQGDARRDGAFTIFYMGINLGAFMSPLVCGTLGEMFGWHYGFGAAGVGMGLGLVCFLALHKKFLGNVGLAPQKTSNRATSVQQAPKAPLSKVEGQRVAVIFILAAFSMFFWAAFEQAGGLMNLYTDQKVDRVVGSFEVPTTWFQSVNPLIILLLAPVFASLWVALGKKNRDPSSPVKFAVGLILLAGGFVMMMFASQQSEAVGKASLYWVLLAYLFHTMGELCLSPVGLSMVTKLAPQRMVSLMMGVWLLSSAGANYVAGWIGGLSAELGEYQLFTSIVIATAFAGVVLLAFAKPLKRMMHGAEGGTELQPEPAPAKPAIG
ncbi:MAG: peptide MFS transporter [Myxococcaceae bacterium]